MRRYTELKEQLGSLQNLRQIVSALRSLAAVRLQEARATLASIQTYTTHIEASLRLARQPVPIGETKPTSAMMLVIAFMSEHGFVGSLNAKVLDTLVAELDGRDHRIIAVGTRGTQVGLERGFNIDATLPAPSHASTALPLVNRLTEQIYERLARGEVDGLLLCYPRPTEDAQWEVSLKRLLPLPDLQQDEKPSRLPPLTYVARDRLAAALVEEWLFAEIMQAQMLAFAAENGARLTTMESIHGNIAEKLDRLSQQTSAIRQEEVTTELMDIVIGAQAVLANPVQNGVTTKSR